MAIKMPCPLYKHGTKGFTLTELAIVLGIIGIILGTVWAAAASVYASSKAAKVQTAVMSTVQSVRSMYANIRTTAAGNLTVPGMFPSDWTYVTGGAHKGAVNPWHTSATAAYAYVIGNAGGGTTQFAIELDAIDVASCVSLVDQFSAAVSSPPTGNGTIAGLVGTAVSTGSVTAGTPVIAPAGAIPIGTFATADECSMSGTPSASKGNSVIISFDLSQM